jgi:hypothetical protein
MDQVCMICIGRRGIVLCTWTSGSRISGRSEYLSSLAECPGDVATDHVMQFIRVLERPKRVTQV